MVPMRHKTVHEVVSKDPERSPGSARRRLSMYSVAMYTFQAWELSHFVFFSFF